MKQNQNDCYFINNNDGRKANPIISKIVVRKVQTESGDIASNSCDSKMNTPCLPPNPNPNLYPQPDQLKQPIPIPQPQNDPQPKFPPQNITQMLSTYRQYHEELCQQFYEQARWRSDLNISAQAGKINCRGNSFLGSRGASDGIRLVLKDYMYGNPIFDIDCMIREGRNYLKNNENLIQQQSSKIEVTKPIKQPKPVIKKQTKNTGKLKKQSNYNTQSNVLTKIMTKTPRYSATFVAYIQQPVQLPYKSNPFRLLSIDYGCSHRHEKTEKNFGNANTDTKSNSKIEVMRSYFQRYSKYYQPIWNMVWGIGVGEFLRQISMSEVEFAYQKHNKIVKNGNGYRYKLAFEQEKGSNKQFIAINYDNLQQNCQKNKHLNTRFIDSLLSSLQKQQNQLRRTYRHKNNVDKNRQTQMVINKQLIDKFYATQKISNLIELYAGTKPKTSLLSNPVSLQAGCPSSKDQAYQLLTFRNSNQVSISISNAIPKVQFEGSTHRLSSLLELKLLQFVNYMETRDKRCGQVCANKTSQTGQDICQGWLKDLGCDQLTSGKQYLNIIKQKAQYQLTETFTQYFANSTESPSPITSPLQLPPQELTPYLESLHEMRQQWHNQYSEQYQNQRNMQVGNQLQLQVTGKMIYEAEMRIEDVSKRQGFWLRGIYQELRTREKSRQTVGLRSINQYVDNKNKDIYNGTQKRNVQIQILKKMKKPLHNPITQSFASSNSSQTSSNAKNQDSFSVFKNNRINRGLGIEFMNNYDRNKSIRFVQHDKQTLEPTQIHSIPEKQRAPSNINFSNKPSNLPNPNTHFNSNLITLRNKTDYYQSRTPSNPSPNSHNFIVNPCSNPKTSVSGSSVYIDMFHKEANGNENVKAGKNNRRSNVLNQKKYELQRYIQQLSGENACKYTQRPKNTPQKLQKIQKPSKYPLRICLTSTPNLSLTFTSEDPNTCALVYRLQEINIKELTLKFIRDRRRLGVGRVWIMVEGWMIGGRGMDRDGEEMVTRYRHKIFRTMQILNCLGAVPILHIQPPYTNQSQLKLSHSSTATIQLLAYYLRENIQKIYECYHSISNKNSTYY